MTRILWALSENIEIMTLIAMVLRLRIGVEKISSNGDRELTRLAPTYFLLYVLHPSVCSYWFRLVIGAQF